MATPNPIFQGRMSATVQKTALALHREGIVKNGNPASWRSHYLRHVWETQAAHAGMLDGRPEEPSSDTTA